MLQTKYLEHFKKLQGYAKEYPDSIKLRGESLVIERLEQGELTSKGGIIIANAETYKKTTATNRPEIGIVLMVGEGYHDYEKDETVPLTLEVGNVVLLPQMAVSYYSQFPTVKGALTDDTIGLIMESQIGLVFKSLEEYNKIEEQVGSE